MAFQRIGGGPFSGRIVKWEETKPGTVFEGVYVRPLKGKAEYGGKNSYILKLDETGEEVLLRNSTVLERKFEDEGQVRPGERVRVEYPGKATPKKGGKPYHNFVVDVDRDAPVVIPDVSRPMKAPEAPVDTDPQLAALRKVVGTGAEGMLKYLKAQHGENTPEFEAAFQSVLKTYGA